MISLLLSMLNTLGIRRTQEKKNVDERKEAQVEEVKVKSRAAIERAALLQRQVDAEVSAIRQRRREAARG